MPRVKTQLWLIVIFLALLAAVVIVGYQLIRAGDIHAAEGKRLYQVGRFADAEQAYRRAVDAAPEDARSWFWLGMSSKNQGRSAEAAEALEQATELDASHPTWWLEYAEALMWAEHFAEAEGAYQQGISLMKKADPLVRQARVNMARAMAARGKAEAAVRMLQEMLAEGDEKNIRFALAEVLFWSGRLDESAAEYRRALGEGPAATRPQQEE